MNIYIVRHGKAERDPPQPPYLDEHRPLAPRGIEQARHLAATIAAAPARPELILTSGLARALETARILHAALDCRLQLAPQLETGHDAAEALDLIERLAGKVGTLMLVGHNPQLGEVATILCDDADCLAMLRTGEAILLEVRPGELIGTGRLVGRLRLEDESRLTCK